jgi:hypothetical protein
MFSTGHVTVAVVYIFNDGAALSRQFLEQQTLVQLTRQRAGDEYVVLGEVDVF